MLDSSLHAYGIEHSRHNPHPETRPVRSAHSGYQRLLRGQAEGNDHLFCTRRAGDLHELVWGAEVRQVSISLCERVTPPGAANVEDSNRQ